MRNPKSSIEHRWRWAKGCQEAKKRNKTINQANHIRSAVSVFGTPVPPPRTLSHWMKQCRNYSTIEEYLMSLAASANQPTDHFPVRVFDDQNVDDPNLATFCNFDVVSKNCLYHSKAGSKVVADLPRKDSFCMEHAVHYLETQGLLHHRIAGLEGYDLPSFYDFALDLIPARETSLDAQRSILGAKMINCKMEPQRCYEARLDGVNTIIAWPTVCFGSGGKHIWNYGSLQQLNHSDEDVDWYMRYESFGMKEVPRYITQGQRVGPQQVLPPEYDKLLNSRWFSDTTIVNRKYSHKGGVNPYLQYDSIKTGRPTKPRQPQRRVVGIKRTRGEVRRMLVDYPAYRRITLAEEHQRLCFQVFVCTFPLPRNRCDELGVDHDKLANGKPKDILLQVNAVLDDWSQRKDAIMEFWRDSIPDFCLSEFEMFLLEYKCTNGSLLQFDQLACHCDKSENHIIESTKIVAKVNPDDARSPSRLVRDAIETGRGQTIVPFIDRAFSFRPVRDRGNFRLDGSPHLGDDSRGVDNCHEGSHSQE